MNIRSSLWVAVGLAIPSFAFAQSHWGYEGATGPTNWGQLSPDNVMCAKGRNQAPINISGPMRTALQPLQPAYPMGSSEIVNNGHTVQVNFQPGNKLVVDKVTFNLKQMHFHAPSENQINGKSFPLEAHFVHADEAGDLLVVSMMFNEGPANAALAKVWAAMPPKAGPAAPLADAVKPMQVLPKSLTYYRFSGSLTTPPCSEGVRWLVLKAPGTASKAQIDAFGSAIGHHNNRPVQAMNGRVVVD